MVVASGRWLGIRLDILSVIFICAVSLMAVIFSQNAGENLLKFVKMSCPDLFSALGFLAMTFLGADLFSMHNSE